MFNTANKLSNLSLSATVTVLCIVNKTIHLTL